MKISQNLIIQILWLAVKIVAILLLSNTAQSFFVYQNF